LFRARKLLLKSARGGLPSEPGSGCQTTFVITNGTSTIEHHDDDVRRKPVIKTVHEGSVARRHENEASESAISLRPDTVRPAIRLC
jgi:hypothetical protein